MSEHLYFTNIGLPPCLATKLETDLKLYRLVFSRRLYDTPLNNMLGFMDGNLLTPAPIERTVYNRATLPEITILLRDRLSESIDGIEEFLDELYEAKESKAVDNLIYRLESLQVAFKDLLTR